VSGRNASSRQIMRLQGVAGNKKGECEVGAQFLSKLHTTTEPVVEILLNYY
jgi:hypothetical protein